MKIMAALLLLALGGCTTLDAKNRILLCIGFCALQGVEIVQKDGTKIVLPPVAKEVPAQ